jgi:ABC-type antimicrobial peptide transport system permease subunit
MGDNLLPPNNNIHRVPLKELVETKIEALKEYLESKIGALKEYTESRFEAYKVYTESRLVSLEKATSIAASNMEKRLEGMNEFRDQLRDQTGTFITRIEIESQIKKIEEDIKVLRESKANLEGKASQQSVYIAYLIALIGIIIGVINLIR